MDEKLLYFAYGSNLNSEHTRTLGLSNHIFRPAFPAWLPDNSINFNYFSTRRNGGALNIMKNLGHYVSGYIYEIDNEALEILDKKEGHPDVYRREKVVVLDNLGNEILAIAYRVTPEKISQTFEQPTDEYIRICETGRNELSISLDEFNLASRNSKPTPCNHLFFYGTLMTGEINCRVWSDHRIVGYMQPAKSRGVLFDHGHYPGLSIGGEEYVRGEVIEFYDIQTILRIIDTFEGFEDFGNSSNLFRRTLLKCHVGGGNSLTCWAYTSTILTDPIIKTYDWRKHRPSNFIY